MKPFQRPPFRSVPERPRRSHGFLELPQSETVAKLAGEQVRLTYRELGSGPPLLLVHGLMTTSYSWRYVMEPLSELGFRVIAYDLPGAGDSSVPSGACTAELLARSIAAFQDALDIAGCKTIGNSMGGYLAMRLALDEPERFERLVNLHSPGVPLKRLWVLRTALRLPGTRAALSAVIARDPERWVYSNVHYFDETLKSREETRVYAAPLRTREGRRAFLSWMGEALDPALMQEFVDALRRRRDGANPGFPVPLQLVYARQDPMVPPRVGHALAALIPDADEVWLEQSSHFAHVDTPELFVDTVRSFLTT